MDNTLRSATKNELRQIVAQAMHAQQVLSYQSLCAGITKKLHIEIADKDLHDLKANNYRLCIAKKVEEGQYNVVWKSFEEYSTFTDISWEPKYAMFATKSFKDGVDVTFATRTKTIGLGQTCVLDTACALQSAKSGGPNTGLTMDNQYNGAIHVGINQILDDGEAGQQSKPIYVAPSAALQGVITLTPVEIVQVWFSQNLKTSTMFSSAVTKNVEANFTEENTVNLKFEGQKWDLV